MKGKREKQKKLVRFRRLSTGEMQQSRFLVLLEVRLGIISRATCLDSTVSSD